MNIHSLDKFSKLANIILSIIAACSLVVGLISYLHNSDLQKLAMTNQIFSEYSKSCLKYPQYANGLDSVSAKDPKQIKEYYNFADLALYSGETILLLNESDSAWIGTVQDIIKGHKDYVQSGSFPWNHFNEEMNVLINRTLKGKNN